MARPRRPSQGEKGEEGLDRRIEWGAVGFRGRAAESFLRRGKAKSLPFGYEGKAPDASARGCGISNRRRLPLPAGKFNPPGATPAAATPTPQRGATRPSRAAPRTGWRTRPRRTRSHRGRRRGCRSHRRGSTWRHSPAARHASPERCRRQPGRPRC